MQYPIQLRQYIIGKNGSCSVYRFVKLPFAPYVGLSLSWMLGVESDLVTIEDLYWDLDDACFVATVMDQEASDADMKSLLEEKENCLGWHRVSNSLSFTGEA